MNERDFIIWAAGFFDGEGCVSIGKFVNVFDRSTGKKTYVNYHLSVIVGQRAKLPLERLKELFGGILRSCKARGRTKAHWEWKANGKLAAAVLEKMLPYLQFKRDVAEFGLRFAALSKPRTVGVGYSEEEKAQREMMYLTMRHLNTHPEPEEFTDSEQLPN